MTERAFPILESAWKHLPTLPHSVPWQAVAPYEARAQKNHSQSLNRLAERGGLSWLELANVIEGKDWDFKSYNKANDPELIAREACAAMRVLRHVAALSSEMRPDPVHSREKI